MQIHWYFIEISIEFQLDVHWISIVISILFQLDFKCFSIHITLKFSTEFSAGFPNDVHKDHRNFNWTPNGFQLVFH